MPAFGSFCVRCGVHVGRSGEVFRRQRSRSLIEYLGIAAGSGDRLIGTAAAEPETGPLGPGAGPETGASAE
jgi:hypothetical protein